MTGEPFAAAWRKRVTINLIRNEVVVARGVVVPFFTRTYPLRNYHRLTVETVSMRGEDGPSDKAEKVVKKFVLEGRRRLPLATRCYGGTDVARGRVIKALAQRLRTALEGHLGPAPA